MFGEVESAEELQTWFSDSVVGRNDFLVNFKECLRNVTFYASMLALSVESFHEQAAHHESNDRKSFLHYLS